MRRRLVATVLLCLAVGTSLGLSLWTVYLQVSPKELLREAVRTGGPLEQIYEEQAGQGYYNDALATARLDSSRYADSQYELSGYIANLIEMRAQNGDFPGAREMVRQYAGTALKGEVPRMRLNICRIQVDLRDLRGALQNCNSPKDHDAVMEEFAMRQMADGDLDGALKTSEQVSERTAWDIFYTMGDVLGTLGERNRLHELASHMTDKKLAAAFLEAAGLTSQPPRGVIAIQVHPCVEAFGDALDNKFEVAWALVHQNHCPYTYNIALKEYPVDPMDAERELRASSRNWDVVFGLARMAEMAAKNGDIFNALRLLNASEQIGKDQSIYLDATLKVAWAWTLKSGPRVPLDWARALPIREQRGYALLGIADALGHARPKFWLTLPGTDIPLDQPAR